MEVWVDGWGGIRGCTGTLVCRYMGFWVGTWLSRCISGVKVHDIDRCLWTPDLSHMHLFSPPSLL